MLHRKATNYLFYQDFQNICYSSYSKTMSNKLSLKTLFSTFILLNSNLQIMYTEPTILYSVHCTVGLLIVFPNLEELSHGSS